MRDLNECKKEVFYRSSARIRERRQKRNRILTFCMVLCLSFAVLSIPALPSMKKGMNDGGEDTSELEQLTENLSEGDGSSGNEEMSYGIQTEVIVGNSETMDGEPKPDGKNFDIEETAGNQENSVQVKFIRTEKKNDNTKYTVVRSVKELEEIVEFSENYEKYNAEFFEEKGLVVIFVEEASSAVGHRINSVKLQKSKLVIDMERIVPEDGDCDKTYWNVVIEIDEESIPTRKEDVQVYYNGEFVE